MAVEEHAEPDELDTVSQEHSAHCFTPKFAYKKTCCGKKHSMDAQRWDRNHRHNWYCCNMRTHCWWSQAGTDFGCSPDC